MNTMWIVRVFSWGVAQLAHISRALTVAMLAVSYFTLITPLAVVFRLFGRDLLHLKRMRNEASLWRPHDPGGSGEINLSRPF